MDRYRMLDLVTSWLQHGDAWGYAAVLIAAATPWIEILLVIPPAIALGLNPVAVAAVAFIGNVAPVVAIVTAADRLARRRAGRGGAADSGRARRAKRLLARYGVPGLALLGPLLTGIHLAAVLALATGASRRRILAWMAASLLAWTAVMTTASVLGLGLVRG